MTESLSEHFEPQHELERALAKSFFLVGSALQSNDESLGDSVSNLHQALERILSQQRFKFVSRCFELSDYELKLIGLVFIQAIEPDSLTPYLGLTWYEQGPYLSLDKLLTLALKQPQRKAKVSSELRTSNVFQWGLLRSNTIPSLTESIYLAPELLRFLQTGEVVMGETCMFSQPILGEIDGAFLILNEAAKDFSDDFTNQQLNSVFNKDIEFARWYAIQVASNQGAMVSMLTNEEPEGLTQTQIRYDLAWLLLFAHKKKVIVLLPQWAKSFFDSKAETIQGLKRQPNLACCFICDSTSYIDDAMFNVREVKYPSELTLTDIWLELSPVNTPTEQDRLHARNVATRYPVPIPHIQTLVSQAALNERADFWQALAKLCLLEQKKGPSDLATLIEPRYRLSDMVLSDGALEQLQELVARNNYQSELKRRLPRYTKGCKALFWGRPGTGKSMAAEAIAGELQLPVYVVNLANIASKWIGETEKHLANLFDEAQRCNAVLMFDEADAVFAKRSKVESSHDKNANMGVSYLLQRMEHYSGLLLLSTNLKANLDEAFIRRFHSVVEFALPNHDQRKAIWERVVGDNGNDALLADLDKLAKRFELSAAQIINITETALLQSLMLEQQTIDKGNIAKALRRELSKQHEGFMAQHEIRDWLEGN
ncbi:hypothetical protein N474_11000 [Pseudoalteromonas luteoviolacea CPMOR-2]|uniref:ATP-binding protein n=1 Tax=Pseudoalteromonas luteoviolacea TaxID=43657 RepID=UPI0007B0AD0C|nr:ATP-binding protein [Pseudoalteromonas luteoviolacea]KZN56672.1 hypothetical protein N474_11000 [Pseudoalteromonas luteoviolacea CPMOR-2]